MTALYHAEPLFPTSTKVCNTCKQEKPIEAFRRDNSRPDGRMSKCIQCKKNEYASLPEEKKAKVLADVRNYRETHSEQVREKQRERNKLPHRRAASNAHGKAVRAKARAERELQRQLNPPPPKVSKICPKCGIEQPLESYPLRRDCKDGRGSYCKACNRKYHHNRLDKSRQYIQSRGIEFRRAKYATHKEWRRANAEKIKEQARLKYATDSEHAARIQRNTRKWHKQNPLKRIEEYKRYQSRKKQYTVEPVSYEAILERDGLWCYICEKDILSHHKIAFDHVIPLSPRHGEPQGMHTEANIHVTHRVCNTRKSNIPFEKLTPFQRRGPAN